jgi:hypothetical protein
MTLIEVLIAITLVALLSVGMLYSLRTGIGSVETIRRHLQRERRATTARAILDQEFANLLPVIAPCGAGEPGTPTANGVAAMFFQGSPEAIRFVSSYSLEGGGRGRVHMIELFPLRAEQGGVRLVLNERLYASPFSAGALCAMQPATPDTPPQLVFPAPVPTPRSFVLADRVQAIRFAFRVPTDVSQPERWVAQWADPAALPDAVRIDMTPLEATDTGTLAPLPFVARIAPDRNLYDQLTR